MATYVNDLRLKEIATGDESGTWGASTNTNLELIAEAFSFGTEAITTNADTHTTTIADGSTDPGRSLFLKYTGTLDSACTITIGPNTVSKLWLIENATSGSQNIIIKQGSGATVTIANGQTKAIYSDGAGSGGAMVDAFQDLSIPDLFIDDDLTFTSDSAVITFGADGDTTLTHTDGSGLTLNSTNKLMFNDASQFIQGSSATVLSLGATDEIDLTATAIDVNGTIDVSGNATLGGTLGVTGAVTANAGVVVDNITIDGQEIDVSSGDLTLDVAGDIHIDAAGGQINFKDSGTTRVTFELDATPEVSFTGGNLAFNNLTTDADIAFKGFDDSSFITALTLDMSNAGAALFNGAVTTGSTITVNSGSLNLASDGGTLFIGADIDMRLTHDGADGTFRCDTGDMTFDVAGDITLDAGGANINFSDDGTAVGHIEMAGQNLEIKSKVSDKDILLKGNDGGSAITALTLDMSEAGEATFNAGIKLGDGHAATFGAGGDLLVYHSSDENIIQTNTSDQDLLFKGNDGGSSITALTLDMSAAGIATFNSGINIGNRGSASDPTLQSSIDPDTGIFWGGSNILGFASGGAERLRVSSEVVVNDASSDADFRVESDGNTHMLFVDAGNDHVNVGGSTDQGGHLNVMSTGDTVFTLATSNSTADGRINFRNSAGNDQGRIWYKTNTNAMEFYTNGSEVLEIDNSGHFFPASVNSQDLGKNGSEFRSLYLDTSIISSNPLGIVCGTHLEVDVGGNIKLDADDAGEVRFLDGGTQYAQIKKDGNNALFQSIVADGDFLIQGITGSSFVTAVTFDMSSSGSATFGGNVICSDIKASGSGGLALQTDDGVKRITLEDSGTITLGGNSIAAATTLNARRSTATGDIIRITGGNSNVSEFGAILIHGENVTGGTQKGIITFNTIDVASVGDATLQERVRVTAEGPTRFVSGSSTVPGITFLNDTNTGFNNASADNIGFVVGGSQKAFLSASQFNVTGNGVFSGSISKGSGSFKIDHPLPSKTDTHHLVHSFVEAPQADNIYRGSVDLVGGSATVNIDTAAGMTDGTFVLLNTNIQCFTSNESGWTAIKGSVSGNTLTITAQDNDCTDTISWMVVGERHDQHMKDTEWTDSDGKVIVEPEKVSEGE
jgi:hypothetical protein